MNPSIGTGLGAEVTGRAFLFVQAEMAVPGKSTLRAGLHAVLWIAGRAELNFFLFGPVRADPDSRTFGSDASFMSDGTDHLADATAGTQRGNGFNHDEAPKG